jgi:hypothetical protein
MQSVLTKGLRPALSPTLNAPIMNFIMQCWAQQADHRPQNFTEVIQVHPLPAIILSATFLAEQTPATGSMRSKNTH